MSLLLDQNLSHRIVAELDDLFPGSTHARTHQLHAASDTEIWEFARDHGLAIVTKDDDFLSLALVHGAPPKVVWLRLGNCTTSAVVSVLKEHTPAIRAHLKDADSTVLVIDP